ncbi:MAG: methyltransferase [Candidatus Aureabacteria bacterium]|nr:methyltransferase [Candidatus Auribacterota bacterium]
MKFLSLLIVILLWELPLQADSLSGPRKDLAFVLAPQHLPLYEEMTPNAREIQIVQALLQAVGIHDYSRISREENGFNRARFDTASLDKDVVREIFNVPYDTALPESLDLVCIGNTPCYIVCGDQLIKLTAYYLSIPEPVSENLLDGFLSTKKTILKEKKFTPYMYVLKSMYGIREFYYTYPPQSVLDSFPEGTGLSVQQFVVFPGTYDVIHPSSLISARAVNRVLQGDSTIKKVSVMGCGIGIEAVLAAQSPGVHVTASDIKKIAVAVTRLNLSLNGIPPESFVVKQSNLFSSFPDERFDAIFFNMPHIQNYDISFDPNFPDSANAYDSGILWKTTLKEMDGHLYPGRKAYLINEEDFQESMFTGTSVPLHGHDYFDTPGMSVAYIFQKSA